MLLKLGDLLRYRPSFCLNGVDVLNDLKECVFDLGEVILADFSFSHLTDRPKGTLYTLGDVGVLIL